MSTVFLRDNNLILPFISSFFCLSDTNINNLAIFAGHNVSLPYLEAMCTSRQLVMVFLGKMTEQQAYVDWKPSAAIEKVIGFLKAVCRAIVATEGDNTLQSV
jgi:hypothetical protein